MSDIAIRTRGLTKSFGDTLALRSLDLEVPRGIIFGYLGPNGAGKTTTIRLLNGLLRPTSGGAEVLGKDIVTDRDQVHASIGYLPGEFVAYRDLTARRYLNYLAELRGGIDWSYAELLIKRFDLEDDRRIGDLSHGNRQKVGLIQAVMHRPPVVVLDEPTQGLDPLMQHEFLTLMREIRDEGGTVFLSSHVLDEVEAVADRVGILRQGELLVVEEVAALKEKALRRIDLVFEAPAPLESLRSTPGVRSAEGVDRTAHVVVEGSTTELLRRAAPYGIENIVTHEVDLEEIFLTYYQKEQP